MKIVDMPATGDDNILSDEEKQDLEYRKAQVKQQYGNKLYNPEIPQT